MPRFLITTLAEYQTRFWVEIGKELQRRGHDALFLSFDSRSNEMLREAGLACADATASACAAALGDADPRSVCEQFGIDHLNFWLSHERHAFGARDSQALMRKLAGTLLIADRAIAGLPSGSDTVMVQELGGFLSVVGSHFAALKHGLPSWFIEPSFFRGRMLFLEGQIHARRLPSDARAPVEGEVEAYLDDTLARGAIVIPEKDRHLYSPAFRKAVNFRNAKRLVEKLVDKHLLGKEQEFGYIGSHVWTHARMIAASRKLARHYTSLSELGRFVYFPLHVPGDMALTLRSPEFLDQIALIDYLCRIVPADAVVAVKEHPAMIGAMGAAPLLGLKRRYDNFHLITPATNNYEVLRRADAVVTVNSKSGAEAGLVGQRVLVLGDAFYRDAPFARPVATLTDLGAALEAVLGGTDPPPAAQAVREYFAALWQLTLPGDLYVSSPDNVRRFTDSIVRGTGQ